MTDSHGHKAIDHLTHTRDLVAKVVGELPRRTPDGLHLSDHSGLVLDVHSGGRAKHAHSEPSGMGELAGTAVEETASEEMRDKVRSNDWSE